MEDQTLQIMKKFIEFRLRLSTPFPLYKVDKSSEENAFNAGVHYGLRHALEILEAFKTAEELSDHICSVEDSIEQKSRFYKL